jgi:glucose-1-phosphate adenylyltransferase
VIIERGSKIKNSIIMSKCHIHVNAQMEYAILDKAVMVHEGNVLMGSLSNPLVVHKGTVI